MCVLEQQLYSRLVFYGRFMNAALRLFVRGISIGVSPRGRRLAVNGGGRAAATEKGGERMRCDADFHS